jgi:hypothetical protein
LACCSIIMGHFCKLKNVFCNTEHDCHKRNDHLQAASYFEKQLLWFCQCWLLYSISCNIWIIYPADVVEFTSFAPRSTRIIVNYELTQKCLYFNWTTVHAIWQYGWFRSE